MSKQSEIDKGWVRDGILSSLAKGPRNSTDIAKDLGVSKATVSYHTKSLVRKGMIEISDVKSVRGGVYSKTFSLKPGNLVLIHRAVQHEEASSKLDEIFERMLMSWHLDPKRPPSDEVKVFLYHAFRLMGEAASLDSKVFDDYGARVGEELVAGSLSFETLRSGLKEFVAYFGERQMADMRLVTSKTEAMVLCSSCFENTDHGSLVCDFTKGVLEGALRAKRGGKYKVDRTESSEISACTFNITGGRLTHS